MLQDFGARDRKSQAVGLLFSGLLEGLGRGLLLDHQCGWRVGHYFLLFDLADSAVDHQVLGLGIHLDVALGRQVRVSVVDLVSVVVANLRRYGSRHARAAVREHVVVFVDLCRLRDVNIFLWKLHALLHLLLLIGSSD